MNKTVLHKWMVVFVLSLGAGLIYQLPYLRFTYYIPLQKALGLDHTQFGTLMSAYGTIAMLSYWPGGWLADRMSTRKLLTFSLVFTGLGGFWFATFPSYSIALLINALWAITSVLTFWAALIKVLANISSDSDQGKIFGFVEGGRGLSATIVAFFTLWLFSRLGSRTEDLGLVIGIYSGCIMASGVLAWFVLEDDAPVEAKAANVLHDIKTVLTMPTAWLMSGVVFFIYICYAALSYTTPYMTEMFGLSVVTAGTLSVVRTQVLKTIGGPVGGILTARRGSACVVIRWLSFAMALALGMFLITPANPSYLYLMIFAMLLLAGLVFALRGIYFAPIKEAKIDPVLVGAVSGFMSLIGYIPDTFIYTFIGYLLDKYPGGPGYQVMFGVMTASSLMAVVMVTLLMRHLSRTGVVDFSRKPRTDAPAHAA